MSLIRSPWPARRLVPALLAVLLLAACDRARDEPVVFGVAAPLGESYGASMRQGAELARREINAAGGVGGRPLELRVYDDSASPQRAIAVADRLYRDPAVVAVVGPVNSGTTTAAAPVYQQGLVAVATSATSPELTRLGEWIFRVATSDSANGVQLARRARQLDTPTAILYENDDYGRGLARAFGGSLLASGGVVVSMDPYLDDTRDFGPYLERLRRRGAGLIFIAGIEAGGARIIQQARAAGIDVRFLGGDGLEGLKAMGPAYDGTLVGLLYHPDHSAAAREFADRFRAAFGRDADSFAALGYDATRLLAAAAEQAGAERESIRRWLAGVGREGGAPPFAGVTGTIRFDDNGDPVQKEFAVGEIRDGGILLTGQL